MLDYLYEIQEKNITQRFAYDYDSYGGQSYSNRIGAGGGWLKI